MKIRYILYNWIIFHVLCFFLIKFSICLNNTFILFSTLVIEMLRIFRFDKEMSNLTYM